MKLWENWERFYEVKDVETAKRMVTGFDDAMACVDCDPQSYRLINDHGDIVWQRPGYRIP